MESSQSVTNVVAEFLALFRNVAGILSLAVSSYEADPPRTPVSRENRRWFRRSRHDPVPAVQGVDVHNLASGAPHGTEHTENPYGGCSNGCAVHWVLFNDRRYGNGWQLNCTSLSRVTSENLLYGTHSGDLADYFGTLVQDFVRLQAQNGSPLTDEGRVSVNSLTTYVDPYRPCSELVSSVNLERQPSNSFGRVVRLDSFHPDSQSDAVQDLFRAVSQVESTTRFLPGDVLCIRLVADDDLLRFEIQQCRD